MPSLYNMLISVQGGGDLLVFLTSNHSIALHSMTGECTRNIWTEIHKRVPVKTGRLQQSITYSPRKAGEWVIEEGALHGRYVRMGTRRRTIRPHTKLALYWPGASHPVPFVRHPGNKPNPYDKLGLAASEGYIQAWKQAILSYFGLKGASAKSISGLRGHIGIVQSGRSLY